MKILAVGRQQGKTEQAIKWAAEHNAYIVCQNQREARRVFHFAKSKGIDIHFPITHAEFLEGSSGPGIRAFIVENVDLLIAQMARGIPVVGVTFNKEE